MVFRERENHAIPYVNQMKTIGRIFNRPGGFSCGSNPVPERF
jgi:hypothetical protein